MKFFVRFTKDNKHWSLVDAQHLPAAVALCKTYREDCIVSRMDEATITPKAFLNFDVLAGQVELKEVADKFVYELQYANEEGKMSQILIECAKYQLEEKSNEAMSKVLIGSLLNKYVKGVLFEIEVLGTKQMVLSKKVSKKNVPICIIINKGKKKKNLKVLNYEDRTSDQIDEVNKQCEEELEESKSSEILRQIDIGDGVIQNINLFEYMGLIFTEENKINKNSHTIARCKQLYSCNYSINDAIIYITTNDVDDINQQ